MSGIYDVIVIGAGHAGCEAAYAAARLGSRVGLCTLSSGTVAHMPCNPAVGGTAKGHLVREIDALGGLMGTAIDETGLQFKLLNRSRGPAVWSPRAQADKKIYSAWMKARLEREPNIEWIFAKAGRILLEHGRIAGLELEEGETLRCKTLVVTTGTFLNGLIHIGPEQRSVGTRRRAGVARARGIAQVARLEVGTPEDGHAAAPASRQHRLLTLRGGTGDQPPVPFSFMTERIDRDRSAATSFIRTTASATWCGQYRPVAALQRADFGHWT